MYPSNPAIINRLPSVKKEKLLTPSGKPEPQAPAKAWPVQKEVSRAVSSVSPWLVKRETSYFATPLEQTRRFVFGVVTIPFFPRTA
jgi:hypothetical protein